MKRQAGITKNTITIFLTAVVLIGCQGNKSSSSDPVPAPAPLINPLGAPLNNPYQSNLYSNTGCQVAGSSTNQLLVAPSEATYTNFGGVNGSFNIKFCLQLTGDATQIQQIQNSGKSAPFYYRGAMGIFGTLTLSTPGTMGSCVLPAGVYSIQPTSNGIYDPISFSIPQFEAVSGPHKIIFQLRQGWTKDPNADYLVDRLALDIVALAVQENGLGQASCNDFQGLFLN